MKDTDQRIPDAERDVLACLVRLEQATVKELQEALADVRPMQPASVMTLLKRLEARRLVTRHKLPRGKALAFRPTKKSSGAWRRLVTDLFHQAFGGDQVAFITSFFETRKPTVSEIQQLQQLLDDLKQSATKDEEAADDSAE